MNAREKLTPEKLVELHVRKNLSLSMIGREYGISRQRVHQLKKEYEHQVGKITRRQFVDVLSLKRLLEQKWSAKQIARHHGMSPSTVSRLIRYYQEQYESGESNINIRRTFARETLPQNLLHRLYAIELMTDQEIGSHFGFSAATISLLRKEYNIPTNQDKALRKLPKTLTKAMFEHHYTIEKMTLQSIADRYGCNVMAVLKLKKQYGVSRKST